MPPIGARGSWWWRNAKPKTLGLLVVQKVFHTNLKSLDTHVGVSNEADSVCLLGTPIIFVLPQPFLHQSIQRCHVEAHKDRSLLATHWGLKPEPFTSIHRYTSKPSTCRGLTTSIHTSRNHTWSVIFCQITSTCKSHTSIDTFLPKVFKYTQVQITSFMSSNWQLTGTCNSQEHILVKSKVHATFNYIYLSSQRYTWKNQPHKYNQVYTQKPNLKQKTRKTIQKTCWKKG